MKSCKRFYIRVSRVQVVRTNTVSFPYACIALFPSGEPWVVHLGDITECTNWAMKLRRMLTSRVPNPKVEVVK